MASASGVFDGRSQYTLVLTVTETGTDVPGNYSDMSIDLRVNETSEWGSWTSSPPLTWSWNVNGMTASGATSYDFRNYDVLVLSSDSTRDITHNNDGTKDINFSAGAGGGSVIGSANCSGSMSLSTIPRASTPSFSPSQATAGSAVTISTNRASTSFTHDIAYKIGSNSYVNIATGVGASTSWTPPLTLMNEFPNSTSTTLTIRTITKSGSTTIGTTTKSLTLKAPTSAVPTFTAVTHAEATAGVAANVGAYVQGISKLALAITGAAGVYSSTITAYKIEVRNSAGTVLQTINSASGTTPAVVNATGTVTLRGTVTDSRGRTATQDFTTTFLPWAPPVLNAVSVDRALVGGTVDQNGTYLRVNINAAVSSLINTTERNAINYKISTRPRGTSTWTLKTTQTPGGITFNSFNVVGTYSITSAYDVLVEVYDDFVTTSVIIQVPVAAVFMHWDAGFGVGIGKYRENGGLDVAEAIYGRKGFGPIEVTNWDNAVMPGFYYGASTATNRPTTGSESYVGQVFYDPTINRLVQELRNPSTDPDLRTIIWSRLFNGTSWGAWARAKAVLAGTTTVTGTGTFVGTSSVTFPTGYFSATPKIVVASQTTGTSTGVLVGSVLNPTATGFTLRAQTTQGTNFSSSYNIDWLALQA